MECRACGTIESSGLPALTKLLRGMSGNLGVPIRHHIIAFKAPTAAPGSNAIALRLLHELPAESQARKPLRHLDAAGAAAGMAADGGIPDDGTVNGAAARTAAGGRSRRRDSDPGRLARPQNTNMDDMLCNPCPTPDALRTLMAAC